MKMQRLFTIVFFLCAFQTTVFGQAGVLDPNDPDVIFTSTYQPAAPAWGKISKWGHSNRLSWNPYSKGYKSYYFQGMAFRLKFPKSYQHNVADGKKYPVFVFLHGLGEYGSIWDNEIQLLHGGETHANKVNDGTFDGFLLYPQSSSGYLPAYFGSIANLLDSLVKYVKADLDRVILSGLSAGGQSTWDFLQGSYADRFCAALPISAAQNEDVPYFPNHITIPIWLANGGKDNNPSPGTVTSIISSYKSLGGNIRQTYYPLQGHGVWNSFWAEPDYFPYLSTLHKANPLVYFQHNEFCPNETVDATLALQPGFSAYEWQKDGITIPGATTSSLHVTAYGTYRGRFKRTASSAWSDWSPTPVVVGPKAPTITPPIQIDGMFSKVLPSPDGANLTPLTVPDTYASYEWRDAVTDELVSVTNKFNAPIGQYKVKVTEQFGCSSDFSPVFTVVDAGGPTPPDPAANLAGVAVSNSSIQLDWNDNPTPIHNETAFEIYRSNTSGANYKLVGVVPADTLTFIDGGLSANTKYYYIIRAVNNTGASAVSNEVAVTTKMDVIVPTAPNNLRVVGTTRSSVSLEWDASTDDVAVGKYDIYIDGEKAYSTANLKFTVNNLTAFQTYSFYVRARDINGNVSPASTQVTASAVLSGLTYKYYQGSWSVLPNFNELTPFATGRSANVSLTPRLQDDNFGFLWEGFIKIPVTGSYKFETNSDDGSKLYIGGYNPTGTGVGTQVVNNDGLHGVQTRTGTITLNAGVYPIAIAYFEATGAQTMEVYWSSTAAGIPRQLIPNSAFADVVTPGAGPAKPGFFNATATSFNKVNLSWTDNSNNETGFELSRSTSRLGEYIPIGTTGANVTSFVDSIALNPGTQYWYSIRAVNSNGASQLVSSLEGAWYFDNNLNDGSGFNRSLTGSGSPTYNAADKKEGTHSLTLNGTSQYVDMAFSTNGAFPSNAYSTRTVSVWIKPTAATVSGANKIVYELGGSDNGMALRFNNGALEAGIARANTRNSVSVSNIASNVNWVNGGWNHVVVTYTGTALQLYVNGVQKASTSLTSTTVATSTSGSRIGASNGANAFNSSTTATNYGGQIDAFEIITEPVNATGSTALMNLSYMSDTTFLLPPIPTAPSNLAGVAVSPYKINLTFNDNSNNETAFELYRSVVSTNNYRLLATINAGTGSSVSYADSGLFANTIYNYKVRAIGIGGNSAYTSEIAVKTLNNTPVITDVNSFGMRYGTQKNIALNATDADGDPITLTVEGLPSFATFSSVAGSGTLQFNPAITDQGVYPMSVIAQDNNGGKDTTSFTVTVNSNYVPVISAIGNQTMGEGDSLLVALTANDQDGNGTLVWSLGNAPAFASIINNGGGSGSVKLKPGYAAAGNYTISVVVNDGAGGTETASFNLTVTNQNPPSVKTYIRIQNSAPAPAPWNNVTSVTSTGFKNQNNETTTQGLQFLTTAWNTWYEGAVTGNNSGIYPDVVLKDYYYFGIFGAPETVDFRLTGLTPGAKYNVSLFASSAWSGTANNGSTVYTINGIQKTLNVHFNQQNTVNFSSISPDASGNITVSMAKAAGTPVGYLNAIVLEQPFDDGTAPVKPLNLAAQTLGTGFIKLSWTDIAYNENNYLIYRSTNAAGPFTLLNPGAFNADDTTYIDGNVASNTTYYYKIEATNANGSSGFTNIVSATTSNKAPVIAAISDVTVKGGGTIVINTSATDDPSDILTTTVSGLPSFAVFNSTGNGTGTITFTPAVTDIGVYRDIKVKVTDNSGASAEDAFTLYVTDSTLRSVYVNFGPEGGSAQSAPWNNYLAFPFANLTLSNLMDDASQNTGFSIKLLETWTGNFNFGMTTGVDKGVFPDNVMQSSIYTSATTARTLQIDGLNPAKRYSIGLFTSLNDGSSLLATFASGGQSVTVDAKYNTTTVGYLNGLAPNASGTLQITLTKDAAATYLNLNAMVIHEYTTTTPIIRPFNLFAETSLDSDKIKLTWSDRSNNETGFEIWRSTSPNGTYTLVTTTAANVTTYTNTGLSADTRYYFKVRAKNASTTSAFSNIATNILAKKVVLLNLDVNYPAPAPWNSTNAVPIANASFGNLVDNTMLNTGFEMVITKPFNGEFYAGMTGGGIFPDNVMKSNYWADAGQQCQVKFGNLDVRKKYRIGCFGSADWNSYFIAVYASQGKTVTLNSFHNKSKVVYLDQLAPNEDGEIYIDISTAAGSPYSFTGAFTIEAYTDVPSTTRIPTLNRQVTNPPIAKNDDKKADELSRKVTTPDASAEIRVFPNPFVDKITVEIGTAKPSTVALLLYDINSKLIYRNITENNSSATGTYNINLPGAYSLKPGTYFLNVLVDGKLSKTVKLIKLL
jgi:hypothetical protein